jgi:hypothetical protein
MLVFAGPPTTAGVTANDFPSGYQGYHTYAETEAAIDDAVANYGQGPNAIIKKFSIGQSYQGREIWAVKISDNVNTDENVPEVLSEGLIHAREHISVEMNLYLINLLTQNYGGSDAIGRRVTSLVNSRQIWIIPMVNPDGGEYDISGGVFHGWRKNRQVVAPGYYGIDLNRNWGFMYACCGGDSSSPKSARYRGQYAWQAPEDVALRDFILSRVKSGQQQIKALFNWHSYGEHILWPYGYTKTDVPPTMTVDDHTTLVAIGQHMAALNGYKAMQGSDMYRYDGDVIAWTYGDQRIMSFTLEMYPKWGSKAGAFHPPDTVLAAQTQRNRDAVLYLMDLAGCPYRATGLGATDCGPLYDDFETGRGWTVNPFGTDTASNGAWERAVPHATGDGAGAKQLATVVSGQASLVTGAAAGADANANDLDGLSSVMSPNFRLGSGSWTLDFSSSFAHDASSDSSDFLRISVVNGATVTPVWTAQGDSANENGLWQRNTVSLGAYAGQAIRLLIEARDGAADSLVEAAIDDVRVYQSPTP